MRTIVRLGLLLAAACTCQLSAFAAVPANMLLLGAAQANDAIVAVGERGTILYSVDEGTTWQAATTPTTSTLTAVSFQAKGRLGWAVGHEGLVLITQDGGRSWSRAWQSDNLEDSFLDVCAIDNATVLAVGAYGLGLRSDDAGATWRRVSIQESDSHLNRITQSPNGDLYIAGERGTLLHSIDKGTTWTPMSTTYDGSFYGVLPLKSGVLLAYGLRGHAFRSADSGANWVTISTASDSLLACALETREGRLFVAGQARTLLISEDDAHSFSAPATVPAPATAFLLATPSDHILAFGEGGVRVLNSPPHE